MIRRVKTFLAIVVMLGALAAVGLALVPRQREPSANGRTLSEWLRLDAGTVDARQFVEVTNAVHRIGADAIPVLLRKTRARYTDWQERFNTPMGRLFVSEHWLNAEHYEPKEALLGFSILGAKAAPAIPELSRMLPDPILGDRAGLALAAIGPEAIPALQQALTNQNFTVREIALNSLSQMREGAAAAVPEILAWLQSSDQSLAEAALVSIPNKLPEEEMLRLLTEYARHGTWRENTGILLALRRYPTNVVVAAPLVLPFLTNADAAVRAMATNILRGMGSNPDHAPCVSTNVAKASVPALP